MPWTIECLAKDNVINIVNEGELFENRSNAMQWLKLKN